MACKFYGFIVCNIQVIKNSNWGLTKGMGLDMKGYAGNLTMVLEPYTRTNITLTTINNKVVVVHQLYIRKRS